MSFWDTSALAKLYIQVPDSSDFERFAASGRRIVVSEIVRWELRTVLRRREAEGSLKPGSAKMMHEAFCSLIACGRFREQRITPDLEAEFYGVLHACLGQAPSIFIRTNDAMHLAAARVAGEAEITSADRVLRHAAKFLGFALFPALL